MESLEKFVLKNHTLLDTINSYIDALSEEYEKTGNLRLREKITAFKFYRDSIFNKSLIASHRASFNGLYSAIESAHPNLQFNLDGNKKSLKSFSEKVEKLQQQNNSLDAALKDIHRFRLIIFNKNEDDEEMITLLYDVAKTTIQFFIKKGYIFCKPEDLKDVENFRTNPEEFRKNNPKLWIPKTQIISAEYSGKIKDYVYSPKNNAYQCIHLLFSDEKGKNMFEIQLRTLAMHIRAEHGKAAHLKFKKETRQVDEWNLKDINIPGFQYIEFKDEEDPEKVIIEIVDNVGIIHPVITYARRKTF